MNYIGNAGIYLIETLFGLYILVVLLRFLLQWVRADFYNPISQAIVRVTNPPLKTLRRIIPGWFGIDFASIVLVCGLFIIKNLVIAWLIGRNPPFLGVLVYSLGDLLRFTLWVFIIAVIVRIVASWLMTGQYHPVIGLLDSLTEPFMAPARRILPPFSGIDFSPILVILFLNLTLMLVAQPLLDTGARLMLAT